MGRHPEIASRRCRQIRGRHARELSVLFDQDGASPRRECRYADGPRAGERVENRGTWRRVEPEKLSTQLHRFGRWVSGGVSHARDLEEVLLAS
ncbi:MAG: hypothetical protein JWM82_1834 [Myxococcales bacterium]|nr:hypothetical protein [Myxococcales bacterium]